MNNIEILKKIIISRLYMKEVNAMNINKNNPSYRHITFSIKDLQKLATSLWDLDGVVDIEFGATDSTVCQIIEDDGDDATSHCSYFKAIRVTYDCDIVSIEELLSFFWVSHDAGDCDEEQHSAIFYHNRVQQQAANDLKKIFSSSKDINTIIKPVSAFLAQEEEQKKEKDNNKKDDKSKPKA